MNRNYAIDTIKFFSIYFVICLHTFLVVGDGKELRILNLLVNYFPRYIIPYFFICSGYFLGMKIRNCENPNLYFKKYLVKLWGFFIFWYIFYFIYYCFIKIVTSEYLHNDVKGSLLAYFKSQLRFSILYYGDSPASFHLWFLTALIWSHIILFGFIKINKIPLLVLVSLFLNILGLFGQTYSGIWHLPFQTRDALFFGLFYTTIGYYISQRNDFITIKLKTMKTFYLIIFLFVFSVLQVMERFCTVFFINGSKGNVDYFISSIPLTICLFLITLKHRQLGINTFFSSIGKNVVGIYASHLLFISFISLIINYFNLEFLYKSFLFYLLFTIIVFFLSHIFSSVVYSVLQQSRKINMNFKWI